jgi:threonine dehydrogenase-like Zn-dependent dehydrogenase
VVNVLPGDQQQQQQHSYQPGDRVLGVLRFGAFASHVALPAAYLRPVPQHWTFEQAASYPVQTLTAAYGLFAAGGFKLGQAVLVHSAAGGVGLQALQILSKCDAAVLGLVGSEDKVQMLQEKYGNAVLQHQQAEPQQQQQPGPQQQQDQDKSNGQQQQRPYFEFACRAGDAAGAAQQLSAFLARSGSSGFDVSLDSLGPGEPQKYSLASKSIRWPQEYSLSSRMGGGGSFCVVGPFDWSCGPLHHMHFSWSDGQK